MISLENHSLKHLNTFGIDVNARYYIKISSTEELRETFNAGKISGPCLIMGGGSNLLFTSDFPGTVLHIKLSGKKVVEKSGDQVIIEIQAGEDWDELVEWTVNNNWGGLENLSLIPGQAGTSPIQNIGAYGTELKDVFHSLVAMDRSTGEFKTFLQGDCNFGYRYSIFKGPAKDRYIITSLKLRLTAGNHTVNTAYGAIGRELGSMGISNPSIADVRAAVCNIRKSKLPDPEITGNAGSFFKNPVISQSQYKKLLDNHPSMVAFPSGEHVKLAAGYLIEKAGWKGFRREDAGVHHLQALVIVNHGNASGKQILELAREIQKSVEEIFGVSLEPEVNII